TPIRSWRRDTSSSDLVNLLGNAIKFTNMGEVTVSVSAQVQSDVAGKSTNSILNPQTALTAYRICFAVKDSGIGISPDRLERLFQPFSQVDSSITRNYGGTGLGLVISQRLTEMMGGEIWVESTVGKGSTFYFSIVVPAIACLETHDAHHFKARSSTRFSEYFPLRILVAEDHAVNQKMIRLLLQHLGYHPDIVSNGNEVLEILQRQSYDVVLMDIQMPEMDGLSTTRCITRLYASHRPSIIAMTANAMQGDQEECLSAGMDDYISKPVRLENLIRV
ncbi:MAG: response regulator, partial [Leptolyngbyaceae cyanobacterium SU_3_3]|nr:response regulator [Leptolyngbyaceae cyanobacterium SU_3_3]